MPKLPAGAMFESPLRPYRFHGIDASSVSSTESLADCFMCGKPKLYISTVTGQWDCKTCVESGNPLTFLRRLHEVSLANTHRIDLEKLAAQRKPLKPDSLLAWGICQSVIDGTWLVPGYNAAGNLVQLYRYTWIVDGSKKRMALLPTPQMGEDNEGHKHGYFSAGWNPKKRKVFVAEGLWDAIAVWEGLRAVREGWGGDAGPALSEAGALLAEVNVLGIPSASVFFPSWLNLLEGKEVTLAAQNDHPKMNEKSGKVSQPGLECMKRIAVKAVENGTKKDRIRLLDWSAHSEQLKDGYDCRDWMAESKDTVERFGTLLKLVRPIPDAWVESESERSRLFAGKVLYPTSCTSWKELTDSWKDALYWRDCLEYMLSMMLSVALSTDQVGDQLFLRVIGAPGSAKTRLCDAMLTSSRCYPLEHLKGFHSGWKSGDGKADYSLIDRINHKTLITPEADVIVSNPLFQELMGQQRRIFDGTTGASYKTLKKDRRYTGLRTPWIMAGTPKLLLGVDQSQVGDRFLNVFSDEPSADEQSNILQKVGLTALHSVMQASNGHPEGSMEEKMALAYKKTGGYVDYLRNNSGALLNEMGNKVLSSPTRVLSRCAQLAEFTAWMRVQLPPHDDNGVTVELPTRLTHQYTRIVVCHAVVTNKETVDDEVLHGIYNLARDTASGATLRMVDLLYGGGRIGYTNDTLKATVDSDSKRLIRQLRMMKTIGLVEYYQTKSLGALSIPKWRLTEKAYNLMQTVKQD